jgi:alpha-L-rhamnosidase
VHGPPPAKIFHHYGNTAEIVNITLAGDGAALEYTPKFTYMGFRYVQLTGYPGVPTFETLTAHFLNTMYDLIGDISFSDPNLNAVQHITRMAAMSNFQSIPTDCPQRERRGWLGDAQLSSRTNTFNFGMAGAYTHFVGQIEDAQDEETGATQDCVPWYNHGHQPADPAWGSAYTFLAELIFEQYDDDDVVGLRYDGITKHLDSLTKQAGIDDDGGLLRFNWWGDWCPPSGCKMSRTHTNTALVSSFEYILQLRMVSRFAGILGHTDDAARYAALDKNVSAAFVKTFYNASSKTFVEPAAGPEELTLQTRIALASTLGLVPEADAAAVFGNLVHDIMVEHDGHLNVGIVGVKELLSALMAGGRADVALQVAQTPTAPGWVYMVLQGATTLWETWTGTRYAPVASWNHIMFGSQSAWCVIVSNSPRDV